MYKRDETSPEKILHDTSFVIKNRDQIEKENLSTIKSLKKDNDIKDRTIEKLKYNLVTSYEKIQSLESMIDVVKGELVQYINTEENLKSKIRSLKYELKNLKSNEHKSSDTLNETTYSNIIHVEVMNELKKSLADLETDNTLLKNENLILKDHCDQNTKLSEEIESLKLDIGKTQAIYDFLNLKYNILKKEDEDKQNKIEQYQHELNYKEIQLKKDMTQTIHLFEVELNTLKRNFEESNNEKLSLKDDLGLLNDKFNDQNLTLKQLREDLVASNLDLEVKKNEINRLKSNLEIVENEKKMLTESIIELNKKLSNSFDSIYERDSEITKIKSEMYELSNSNEQNKNKTEASHSSTINSLNDTIKTLNNEIAKRDETNVNLKKEIETYKLQIKNKIEEIESQKASMKHSSESTSFFQTKITNLEKDLEEAKKNEKFIKESHLKDIAKFNIRVQFLENEYSKASEEIASVKDGLHKKTNELLETKEEMFMKEQDGDRAKYDLATVQRSNESLTAKVQTLTTNLEEIRGINTKLIIKSNTLNKLLTEKDEEIEKSSAANTKLQMQLDDLNDKFKEQEKTLKEFNDIKQVNKNLRDKLLTNKINISDNDKV